MALLPQVGRRTPYLRAVVALIYLLLVLGGMTMVVPFLIMVTTSISNDADSDRRDVLPTYAWDQDLRFAKYLAEKYAQTSFHHFAAAHGAPAGWSSFKDLGFDPNLAESLRTGELRRRSRSQLRRIARDYAAFMAGYDVANVLPLFARWNRPAVQHYLREKYMEGVRAPLAGGPPGANPEQAALDRLSRTWGEALFATWDQVQFDREYLYPHHLPRWVPPDDPRHRDFLAYTRSLPASQRLPITTRYLWSRFLVETGITADEVNRRCGTAYRSVYVVPTGDQQALPPFLARWWERFTQEHWPARLTRLSDAARSRFIPYLTQRFGSVHRLNHELGTRFPSLEFVPFTTTLPADGHLRRVWAEFAVTLPAALRTRLGPETAYREFLARRYGTVEAVNQAYGWSARSFEQIELPLREVDYLDYVERAPSHLIGFLTFNVRQVVRYITVRGRALWNTVVLVALTLLFALIVNPLAAYALSRFQLRRTQQILVFLLATMAFPPEVGMIPSFLLLRDMGLLNTFAALVVPGAANGFSIFLLKGFFDSLPQELYEAAALDGANELRIFRQITLPLSAPILSVIGLQAFLLAYAGFMWAFLICQDPRMWTLMVWLYQFQSDPANGPGLMMAAIVVASVPTLLVFLFCQRIILRGIVIPSMK